MRVINEKNLVIVSYFFDSIRYHGLAEHYEFIMQPYSFEFSFLMNKEVQRVEFDSEKDECYIEIWV